MGLFRTESLEGIDDDELGPEEPMPEMFRPQTSEVPALHRSNSPKFSDRLRRERREATTEADNDSTTVSSDVLQEKSLNTSPLRASRRPPNEVMPHFQEVNMANFVQVI